MNSREQILAKRVAALEARLQASMVVIDHLIKDLEFTESVGAAFAFDLSLRAHDESQYTLMPKQGYQGVRLAEDVGSGWDGAVKALESAREETQEESGK